MLHGRHQATCNTAPCLLNHLGLFDSPEDAALEYLQHYERKHSKELAKERAPLPPLAEQTLEAKPEAHLSVPEEDELGGSR